MSCILLTGGTGKIASRIAPLLMDTGHDVVLGSRRAPTPESPNCKAVKFDWMDGSTYADVLKFNPEAVFLVAPPVMQCVQLMKDFIDRAIAGGVKRLVLLSGSVQGAGDGVLLEEVGEYIKRFNIEWSILRPSWFMEDFSEMHHRDSIRDRGEIITATGKGKIPFVAAADVAAVAFKALTEPAMCGREHLLLGPELWSFHDVATHLCSIPGRHIEYVDIFEEELAVDMEKSGMEAELARLLAQLDTVVREGKEDRLGGDLEAILGRSAVRFGEWIDEATVKGTWKRSVS